MRKHVLALVLGALVIALSVGAGVSVAAATGSASGRGKADDQHGKAHNLDGPLSKQQRLLKQKALAMKLAGKVGKNDKVVRVAKGQYVELSREATDKVFVILVEFGNERYPNALFADSAATMDPDPQTFEGPLHNQIPKPDRSVDNSTLWKSDFSSAHYKDMYFNRMAKYYESQSSGRYSVAGEVSAWVKVPFNQALYGRNYCGGIVCNTTKALIRDAMAMWVDGQLKSGKTISDIASYLREYDTWDRYDLNGNGNFNEPDGYIDHLQVVHAGGDEAAGDPTYGTDAIWSHRWYANLQGGGPGGLAGVNIGSNGGLVTSSLVPNNPVGVWVGDYTIQPENGGLGVFVHEYGHDLGLPDLYDTSGNTGGAENSTGFWTLMSSGSNIGDGGPDGIGDDPVDLGAWEKFQLGWLNYEVAFAGKKSEHKLGPAEANTKQAQGLFVVLPKKALPLDLGAPCASCGTKYFFSGSGDNLETSMTKTGVSGTSLTATVNYQIEEDWDYAFLEASANGGSTWTPVSTNRSDTSGDQSGFNTSGTGMTGDSGGWQPLTATLPAGTNAVRFRYETDGAVSEPGFRVDNISLGGTAIGTAETDEGWVFDGFRATTGKESQLFDNYYVVENRQYVGYDRSLKTAYNFGFLNSKPDWVETYPYQDGLLISYWDTSQSDNNVGDHPGEGLLLPIDANPTFHYWANGELLRPRILSYDSTFGLDPRQGITVHRNGEAVSIPAGPAQPVFDDTRDYWSAGSAPGRYQPGWNSVKVPKTGTTVRIQSMSSTGFAQVQVAPK